MFGHGLGSKKIECWRIEDVVASTIFIEIRLQEQKKYQYQWYIKIVNIFAIYTDDRTINNGLSQIKLPKEEGWLRRYRSAIRVGQSSGIF